MQGVMRDLGMVSKVVEIPIVLYEGRIPAVNKGAMKSLEGRGHIEVRPVHRNGTIYIGCYLTKQGEEYLSKKERKLRKAVK